MDGNRSHDFGDCGLRDRWRLVQPFQASICIRQLRRHEITTPGRLPSAPRLQTSPTSDLQQLLEAENAKLNSYGWIDKSAGVVRIPINRAMDLLAQRGLPARGNDRESGGKTPLQMRQEKAEASER